MTEFPLLLPLHIILSPKYHDYLTCTNCCMWPLLQQCLLPQNTRLVKKKNYSCRNLTYRSGFVRRLLLDDSFEDYTDCIFHWPVKTVTTDTECSSQKLMTKNQTWWCHKPSQCRDLSIQTAIQITSLNFRVWHLNSVFVPTVWSISATAL